MLVLLFVIQVKEETRCNQRLRRVIRRENADLQKNLLEAIDAIKKQLDTIQCSVQSLNKRLDNISHDVEQMKYSNPNHHTNERYRSEANQDYDDVIEEANQEQIGAVGVAREGEAAELKFLGQLKPLVYTERKITSEDGRPIDVAMYRDGQEVPSGPLSSARIEIVALHGNFLDVVPDNWTENEFDKQIVRSTQGSVLGGDSQVKLKNGVASLGDIYFKIVSSKTRSGKLILAARVHGSDKAGLRIKEAVMNPVVVQVCRNESNEKSIRPKLRDEVHRLKGISGKGAHIERLKQNNIHTVEDFRKALNEDEEKIRTECFKVKKNNKLWKATVKHAEECDLEGNCKLKSYIVEEKRVVLFFNCVHDLVGAKFHGCYFIKDNFNSDQQEVVNQLKAQAYKELGRIGFDHELKDNYPTPLSTNLSTSIGGDSSFPVTYTSVPNPSDFHTTHQVQDPSAAVNYLFPNNGAGNQGIDVALAPIDRDFSQAGIDGTRCNGELSQALPVIADGASSGGNNLIEPSDNFIDEWFEKFSPEGIL